MRNLSLFVFALTLLIGASYISHGKDLTTAKKTYLKKLLEKVDLSQHDKNIDSLLDKNHVSPTELDLLKSQAMLEALDANSYKIAPLPSQSGAMTAGVLSSGPTQTFYDRPVIIIQKELLTQRLKDIPIEERLKSEFSLFMDKLNNLASKVGEEFKQFRASKEVQNFKEGAESTVEEVESGFEKMVDDFVSSPQFKAFQNAAADIFHRLNQAFTPDKSKDKPAPPPPNPQYQK